MSSKEAPRGLASAFPKCRRKAVEAHDHGVEELGCACPKVGADETGRYPRVMPRVDRGRAG